MSKENETGTLARETLVERVVQSSGFLLTRHIHHAFPVNTSKKRISHPLISERPWKLFEIDMLYTTRLHCVHTDACTPSNSSVTRNNPNSLLTFLDDTKPES